VQTNFLNYAIFFYSNGTSLALNMSSKSPISFTDGLNCLKSTQYNILLIAWLLTSILILQFMTQMTK